jgi:hypothetical protein
MSLGFLSAKVLFQRKLDIVMLRGMKNLPNDQDSKDSSSSRPLGDLLRMAMAKMRFCMDIKLYKGVKDDNCTA